MKPGTIGRYASSFIAILALSAPAHAGLFRAYLSAAGSDGNPCTLSQPCRLLPAALGVVADGGEIWILDSANYNTAPVNIAKSVTILAIPGVVGSVVATGGDAIDIAMADVDVTLRNLVIVPLPGGGGVDGISMSKGASLAVDNCLIANLGRGIKVTAAANVRVIGSTTRGNGNGIWIQGSVAGTTISVDIAESTIDGNFGGVVAFSTDATARIQGSVRDSRVVQNDSGVIVQSDAGGATMLSVSNSIISNNANVGIGAYGAGSKVWASGNTVSSNGTGLYNNAGGTFESAGNNAVRNNFSDTSGAISTIVTM